MEMAGRVTIWQLLREALDLTGYETALALDDAVTGERQLNNVHKLLALARETADLSITTFLRQMRDLQSREVRESEAAADPAESGAVQLMTVHAAKGLEFPVVAVVDMGRTMGSRTASRILHDPLFGLVCQTRDQNGDWQKPASYNWGASLDRRLKIAEHKRLFYVACTRSADLLLLSGKVGGTDSWLTYALQAWDIPDEGGMEETVPLGDFRVRLLRPLDKPDLSGQRGHIPPTLPERAQAVQAYRLAFPLEPAQITTQPQAPVTTLVKQQSDSWRQPLDVMMTTQRAAAARVGTLVHHALASWDCLALPESALTQWLSNSIRRMGVMEPTVIEDGVHRAQAMLNNLITSPLYGAINTAQQRYTELPVVYQAERQVVYGIVDLLYKDEVGAWYLIDWKTDKVNSQNLQNLIEQYQEQLLVYARAVQRQLSVTPHSRLCFLSPRLHLYDMEIITE